MLWLGEPRDKTNKKIEIISYVKYVESTPIINLKPKTGMSKTGAIRNCIKPRDPHEQMKATTPPQS